MKKIMIIITVFLFVFTLSSCDSNKAEYTNISNQELITMLENRADYQFVDVRTYQEYTSMKIDGFNYLMDVYILQEGDLSALDLLDKDKPVVIMCNSGNRSVDAMQIFWDAGFTELYNLEDGIQGWISEGYETE